MVVSQVESVSGRASPSAPDLSSREGVSEALAFIYAFPIWWFTIGIVLVVGLWVWSTAVNFIGLAQASQAFGVGADAVRIREETLAAGLGGFATTHRSLGLGDAPGGRAKEASVDVTTDVQAFPAPGSFTVQQRTLSRIEQFYARPPSAALPGGWE